MRIQKFLLAAALLSLGAASCQKDENVITRFTAGIEQPSKTHLDADGMTLKWDAGDEVMVYNAGEAASGVVFTAANLRNGDAVADLVSTDGIAAGSQYYAIHPVGVAASASSVTLPTVQLSADGSLADFPMYAVSGSTVFHFENLCGALKIHLKQDGVAIKRIRIKAGANINGTYTIGDDFALTHVDGTGATATTLSLATAQSIAGEGHDFYIYLPAGTYQGMELTFYKEDGTCCTKTGTVTVVRSKYSPIVIDGGLTFVAEGRLSGEFSVGSRRTVRFSQGNLQYTTTGIHAVATGGTEAGTWRFAEHQYDCVGSGNSSISASNTGWIDLFGWGTSGWNSGATAYLPYATSGTYSDYHPGGSHTNGLTGDHANADWGIFNAVSNGGDQPGLWRTLTSAEWEYILNSRPNAAAKKAFGRIEVGSSQYVNGYIIVPDNWSGSGFRTGGYSINTYTLTQWEDMEAAGAVFLPAAGSRGIENNAVNIVNVGNHGNYWSSTNGNVYYAKLVVFKNTDWSCGVAFSLRSGGRSVRLVQDVVQDN